LLWYVGIFLATFTASIAIFAVLILVLPPRYFAENRRFWSGRHPLVQLLGLVGKNLLGVGLIVLGLLLSLPGVPGQGLLTVAVGVVLLDVPGKHRLVRWIVKRKGVLRNLNRFRAWFGRLPLEVE
jgi:hypothetical protein